MIQHYLKTLISIFCIMASANAAAYDFISNGIGYTILSNSEHTVSVAQNGSSYSSNYQGSIKIPSTVEYNGTTYSVIGIDEEAFESSRIVSVTIPASVKTIGFDAFDNCFNLSNIYDLASTPQSINSSMFSSSFFLTLHVYQGLKNAYAYASGWESLTIVDDISVTKITSFTLNQSSITINEYQKNSSLKPLIEPSDASIQDLKWTSSDNNIAEVMQDGTVIGVSEGKAVISATTIDGSNLTSTCEVRVVKSGDGYNYNSYISCENGGYSMSIINGYITKGQKVSISNSGKDCIKLTKLIAKNPNTYDELTTISDASTLGWLYNGQQKVLKVTIHKNITPVYELHYLYKGTEYVYCSDTNDPTDILSVTTSLNSDSYSIYNINGQKLPRLTQGINIIKYRDGHVKKIMVK
jgi:uncharacterized protein YjdB